MAQCEYKTRCGHCGVAFRSRVFMCIRVCDNCFQLGHRGNGGDCWKCRSDYYPEPQSTTEETLESCPPIAYPVRVEPEPGYEGVACILDLNSVLIAAMMHPKHACEVAATLNSRISPASAAPVVDNDALGSAVVNLLNAFHGSGHGGVDYMVSARLRGCEKCSTLATMLDRALARPPAAAAATAAPVDRSTLDEIETALISIADGASPQEAVGKAFNIINAERAKLLDSKTPE